MALHRLNLAQLTMILSIITHYYYHSKAVRTYQWASLYTVPNVFARILALRSSRCHRPREFSPPLHKESGILTVESQSTGAQRKVKVLLGDRSAQG
jgi:hypothetical protein